MLDLKGWREKWAEIEREEDRIYKKLTIEESVNIYLALCRSLAPMIEDAKEIFLAEREAYVAEFQERMRKLGAWLQKRNGIATESS